MEKLDMEVNVAMYTMQRTEGQRVQVTPTNKRSLGNHVSSYPMQAWAVTFHYDSMERDCVKATELWELFSHHKPLMGFHFAFAKFENLGRVIAEVTHAGVLRELTHKNILGWVYIVFPGMTVVIGTRDLDSLQALNMFVQKIDE